MNKFTSGLIALSLLAAATAYTDGVDKRLIELRKQAMKK